MPRRSSASLAGRPVVLVVSPSARYAADAPDPVRLLADAGVRVAERLTVADLDARHPRGGHWRRRGYAAVVAAGGDGTLGSVATHVATSGLSLGILPLGSANDVARSLGIPLDPAEAAQTIAHGTPTEVDAGCAAPAVTEPGALAVGPFRRLVQSAFQRRSTAEQQALQRAGVWFLHTATLGLNVEFARLATDVARRERWGRLTYATAMLEALAKLEPVPVTLDLRGVHRRAAFDAAPMESTAALTLECRAVQIAIINMPVFGGRLNLMLPGAHPSDRLLDVVVIEALEPRALRETIEGLLAALGRLKDRLLPSDVPEGELVEPELAAADVSAGLVLPGVHRYQVRAVRLTTISPVDITLDGEIRARTPLEIAVAPVPLRIIVPGVPREEPTPPGFMGWVSRAPVGR